MPSKAHSQDAERYRRLHQQHVDTEHQKHESAAIVLQQVFDLLSIQSVLDVGCGIGTWLNVAQTLGATDIQGVEGDWLDPSLLKIAPQQVTSVDLQQAFDLHRRFDLAICLEVAEHLPPTAADQFIDTLTHHADCVLFSAAIPLQGGTGHINEQWPSYWRQKFEAHDYVALDCIRPQIWDNDQVVWWYRQNTILYVARASLESNAQLKTQVEHSVPSSLFDLVHPSLYIGRLTQSAPQAPTSNTNRVTPGHTLKQQLATVHQQLDQGNLDGAATLCEPLLQQQPVVADAWYVMARINHQRGQRTAALAQITKALEREPNRVEWLIHAAEMSRSAGDYSVAETRARLAIEKDPQAASGYNTLGLILQSTDRLPDAQMCFEKAVQLAPDYSRASFNLGNTLLLQHDLANAKVYIQRTLKQQPDHAAAWNSLGLIERESGHYAQAHEAIDRALSLRPNDSKSLLNRAGLLQTQAQNAQAVNVYQQVLTQHPNHFDALERLSRLLHRGCQWEASSGLAEQALAVRPHSASAMANLWYVRSFVSDWRNREELHERCIAAVTQHLADDKRSPVWPGASLRLIEDPALQLRIATTHAATLRRDVETQSLSAHIHSTRKSGERVKLGYITGGFRNYPFGHLSRRLYGLHDRQHFEVHAYSIEPGDDSEYHTGIKQDCDHFTEVIGWSPHAIAQRIQDDGIHVLVAHDTLLTSEYVSCLAMRPAPVQISWLYPGTFGADFIDHILADNVVIPEHESHFYTESVLRLPHTHYVTDNAPLPDANKPERQVYNLPHDAVVYCCFNLASKIEPDVFSIWMNILRQVPDSVLWLLSDLDVVRNNLRREAEQRGIAGDRLIFTHKLPKAEHLKRQQLADLFLDTRPYNAHTTAVDAMQIGLPLLTCPGKTFASRVAASIVSAAGMPELIADSLDDYEQRAIEWGQHPQRLRAMSERLAELRSTSTLFDTPDFVKHLEARFLDALQAKQHQA